MTEEAVVVDGDDPPKGPDRVCHYLSAARICSHLEWIPFDRLRRLVCNKVTLSVVCNVIGEMMKTTAHSDELPWQQSPSWLAGIVF
jgi:hypothetical protein